MSFTPVDYSGVHANAESATAYGYRTRSDVMDGERATEDDIVEELRETCNWCHRCSLCSTLNARAADEIVRLRAGSNLCRFLEKGKDDRLYFSDF